MSILAARARVVIVGSGRMGHIRSSLLYANPRFKLLGHADVNHASAKALVTTYQVCNVE
jgi:predicted dehydrogenase